MCYAWHQRTGRANEKKQQPQKLSKIRVEFPHTFFRLDRFDQVQLCSRLNLMLPEMNRMWCRLYLLSNNPQAFRSSPLEQVSTNLTSGRALHCCCCSEKNALRLDMSRFTSRSFALDHTQRCRRITGQDLLCRLIRLFGIAPTLQQPGPLLSQAHTFTGSRECSDQLSFATPECDR